MPQANHDVDDENAPRVVETRFVPTVKPAPVSRTLMLSLADRIATESLVHARSIVAAMERAVVELRAGRYEGYVFCMADIEAGSNNLNQSVNDAGGRVDDAIRSLDPAFFDACRPAKNETKIRRLVATAGDQSLMILELSLQLHRECPTCPEAEALKRLIAAKKGK